MDLWVVFLCFVCFSFPRRTDCCVGCPGFFFQTYLITQGRKTGSQSVIKQNTGYRLVPLSFLPSEGMVSFRFLQSQCNKPRGGGKNCFVDRAPSYRTKNAPRWALSLLLPPSLSPFLPPSFVLICFLSSPK